MYIFHGYHNFARQIHQTFGNKTKQKLFLPVLKDLQNYKKIYINNKKFKGLNKLRFKSFLEDLTCQNSDYLSISNLLTGLTCFNDIPVFVISNMTWIIWWNIVKASLHRMHGACYCICKSTCGIAHCSKRLWRDAKHQC